MDDQPKEGGEGDKKIVHTYALVKVSKKQFKSCSCEVVTILQN